MKKNIAILILIIALIVAVVVLAVKLANVKKEDYSGFKMYKNIISQDEYFIWTTNFCRKKWGI